MPKNVVRQSLNKPLHKVGLWRVSSVVMRHKRFTAAGVAVLMVAAVPIASLAISDAGKSSRQAQQKNSSDVTSHEQEPEKQNESPEITEKEGQPMRNEVKVESKRKAEGPQGATVDVTVNGQGVAVPQNGSVHKRMTDSDSKSTVDIQVDNNSSSQNSSSSTVIIEQHSFSTGDETKDTGGSGRHPDRR